jgi:hypothetical protein
MALPWRRLRVPRLSRQATFERGGEGVSLLEHALLMSMRARLDSADAWTQGATARDALGKPVGPESLEARAWSLCGAMMCTLLRMQATAPEGACGAVRREATVRLLRAITRTDPDPAANLFGALELWNDRADRRHAEVIRVLERAIRDVEVNPNAGGC